MKVYYAGEVTNNWAEGLWPHAWNLATPVLLAPGKSAFDYQFTDMSDELTLGTFCHENGHMLCDYPDLYDYGNESSGAGAYCLMCAGGNISEKNPTNISAYLKRLSGWARSVTQIQHNQDIVLSAGENDFAMFAKDSGEYFIVESRIKSGRDERLPDEGLAIWHVDEDGNNSNEQMTPGQHYELSLEQADGEFHLETYRNHYGNATDLFGQANKRFADSTVPGSKWWNGSASNLDIYDITGPGAIVSFKARLFEDFDDSGSVTIQGESSPDLNIPDNQAGGVSDSIEIDRVANIAGVKVTLDISHTYRGDLNITMLTPWGDAIVLHQRHQGGSLDDIQRTIDESDVQALATLKGHNCQGVWRLFVEDLAPVDIGTLNYWALEFTAVQQPSGPVVLEEAPGAHIPDDDPAGIRRTLSTYASGRIGSVEVSVNISHSWIGDLQISIRSPEGSEIMLHNQTGRNANDIIKTYTASTTPSLASLVGESISGEWQLRLSDHAGQDIGKLNNWKILIQPAT